MPFTSNAQKFFNRFGPAQSEPLTNTLQPAKFAFDSAALKSANLFDTINKVRQNEMERQAKQVMIAKALAELQQIPNESALRQAQVRKLLDEVDPNSIDSQYKQAQIQALRDKSEYQSGILEEKQRNQDRLTSQASVIAELLKNGGGDLPPGTTARQGGLTIPVNRKYTKEEAEALTGSDSLINKIADLKEMVGTAAEGYLPFGGGMKNQQSFQTLKDDIAQQLLYYRTGKAINENEFKRFMKLLPQLFRRKEVDKEQLDRFIQDFQPVADRIKQGARYDETGKKLIFPKSQTSSSIDYDSLLKAAGI